MAFNPKKNIHKMKDIQKMRKDFERKIWCAEKSNEIEKQIGIECTVMECGSITQKGKEWLNFGDVNFEQAKKIIKAFPYTELAKRTKSAIDSTIITLPHLLDLHRSPKGSDKLEIEWIHNEYAVYLRLTIEESSISIQEFFKPDSYSIDSSTIGIYFGQVSPSEADRLSRQRALSFSGGKQIRYQGGHFFQTDEEEAERLISAIIAN